jgi:hypothetical protein
MQARSDVEKTTRIQKNSKSGQVRNADRVLTDPDLLALQRSLGNQRVTALIEQRRIDRVVDGLPKSSAAGGQWSSGAAVQVTLTPAETGIQKTQISLVDKAKAIKKIGENVKDLGEKVSAKGNPWYWKKDDSLIELGQSLNSIHKSVNGIAEGIGQLTSKTPSDLLTMSKDAQADIDKILKAAETIETITSTQEKFDAFAKKPNLENANAWATGIGATFSNVAQYLPVGLLPGFMGDYFKGLFSAPAVYIAAFQAYSEYHYSGINKESGIMSESEKKKTHDTQSSDGLWKGLMLPTYTRVAMTFGEGQALKSYMIQNHKVGSVELFYVDSEAQGIAILVAHISADESLTPEQKTAYLQILTPSTQSPTP